MKPIIPKKGSSCINIRILKPSITNDENIFWIEGNLEIIGIDIKQAKELSKELLKFIEMR